MYVHENGNINLGDTHGQECIADNNQRWLDK